MKQHSVREAWLQDAVKHLEPVFSKAGYAIPPVKVSCGFPASSSPRTTLGQCWPRERSGGGVNEIFILPGGSVVVWVINTYLAVALSENSNTLSRLLVVFSLVFSLLSAIAIFRIIGLVI